MPWVPDRVADAARPLFPGGGGGDSSVLALYAGASLGVVIEAGHYVIDRDILELHTAMACLDDRGFDCIVAGRIVDLILAHFPIPFGVLLRRSGGSG